MDFVIFCDLREKSQAHLAKSGACNRPRVGFPCRRFRYFLLLRRVSFFSWRKKAAQMRKAGGEKMGRKWFTKCLQVCVFLETAWIQQVSFKKMKNEKMRFQPRFNMFQGTGPVASMAALASFGLQHMALSQLGNARSTKAAPATASAASVVDGLVSAGTRAAELCAADYVRAARHMTFQHCANIANSSISSLKIVEFLKYILLNPAFQLGRACDSFNERG